jgi:hypothetical protein
MANPFDDKNYKVFKFGNHTEIGFSKKLFTLSNLLTIIVWCSVLWQFYSMERSINQIQKKLIEIQTFPVVR